MAARPAGSHESSQFTLDSRRFVSIPNRIPYRSNDLLGGNAFLLDHPIPQETARTDRSCEHRVEEGEPPSRPRSKTRAGGAAARRDLDSLPDVGLAAPVVQDGDRCVVRVGGFLGSQTTTPRTSRGSMTCWRRTAWT